MNKDVSSLTIIPVFRKCIRGAMVTPEEILTLGISQIKNQHEKKKKKHWREG